MSRPKYQSLQTGAAFIRMLALLPSIRSSRPVQAELIHVDLDCLDQAPFAFYEALSYTWGDVRLPRSFSKLNGHEHAITVNLELALKKLRGRTRKRYLWVDALCINQDDLAERAAQVKIMRRIYESAVQVLVWLGGDADDSAGAIRLMRRFTRADFPDDYVPRSLLDDKDLAQWKAVAKIFDREWFRRVWVRQEVAVANEIIVMCGSERISWNTLSLACDILTNLENRTNFLNIFQMVSNRGPGTDWLLSMEMIREAWAIDRGFSLDILLLHGRGTDASDSRDRVYGLLGLSDIADKLHVDYTISSQEVFKGAMTTLLNHKQCLDSLSGCQWRGGATLLPSWVINFNEDFDGKVLRNKEDGEQLYHASGDEIACFSFLQPTNFLRARGFICDTVDDIGAIFQPGDVVEFRKCFEEWVQLAQRTMALRSSDVTENQLIRNFCRTLTADQDDVGNRASTAFYTSQFNRDTIKSLPAKLVETWFEESTGFSERLVEACVGRVMLGTSKGFIGITDKACQPKDMVCILFGAGVPFIVRRRGSEYILIGEACAYCPVTRINSEDANRFI
jgi:hypothetical protein